MAQNRLGISQEFLGLAGRVATGCDGGLPKAVLRNGDLRQITFEQNPLNTIGTPVWSPRGNQIAFATTHNLATWLSVDYSVVNSDGSNLHIVAPTGTWAAWSGDARFLYYVLPSRKAIRYGVAVGEEAVAWSGVAQVGRKAEWPDWIPTPDIQARLGPYPPRVPGGPANPMGARAIYLYQGAKDTLYRIHGTNQPEFIGQARSSGCIRMTNEDVIDLYDRVTTGATVVVLAPGHAV